MGIATALPSFKRRKKIMLFTIQTEPLIRMVEMVSEAAPKRRTSDPVVRLAASRDRVCVKCGGTAAESDAAVWEHGQCTIGRDVLLKRLKECRAHIGVSVEADRQRLCVEGISMPLLSYSASAPAPEMFQVFMATELGLSGFEAAARPV